MKKQKNKPTRNFERAVTCVSCLRPRAPTAYPICGDCCDERRKKREGKNWPGNSYRTLA